MSEGKYLVALGYVEGEVLDLSNQAFFSVLWTVGLDFLIASVQWLCRIEVQLKFSNFTFKPYIHYKSSDGMHDMINRYQVLPGVKQPGCGVIIHPPSGTEVANEFHLYNSNKLTNQMQQFYKFITWRFLSLNMFRAPPRPSSGAYNCINSLWFYLGAWR